MAQKSYNIPRDVKDVFYRYKMPAIISKIEGRGNGIKTVIPNMADVAKALDRPPSYTTKYFGGDLGALCSVDDKKDRYLVNGAHDAERLQTSLDGFINRFVLCGSCRNPETDLLVSKDERITRVCKACGARTPVDLTHKLCAYIIKNPPLKKVKKQAANNANGNGEAPPSPPPDASKQDDEEDDEMTKQIHAAAADLGEREVDEDDWGEDTSAAAVSERMKKLAVQPKIGDDDDDLEDPVETFATYLTENPNATDAEIVAESISLGVKEHKAVAVMAQVLFNENVLEQIPKRAALFSNFVKDDKAQKGLIGGIERLVGISYKKQLMKKVPFIFKMLYDHDLLEEDVILKWGEKVSKKYVDKATSQEIHEAAGQFLTWLLTAEDEESDEEED
ncbi:hypothetical protein HK098_003244 [Nowakowskiella sp. JEL0407]|nr:hypothetical protein HK098_003244 [Nowakowskiella sp. JEL0407]